MISSSLDSTFSTSSNLAIVDYISLSIVEELRYYFLIASSITQTAIIVLLDFQTRMTVSTSFLRVKYEDDMANKKLTFLYRIFGISSYSNISCSKRTDLTAHSNDMPSQDAGILFIETVFDRSSRFRQAHSQLVVFIVRPVLERETWPRFLSTRQCLHATGRELKGDGIAATSDVYNLHRWGSSEISIH